MDWWSIDKKSLTFDYDLYFEALSIGLSRYYPALFLCLLFAYANADTMQSCKNFAHYLM